jgi:hypothetical protein
LFICNEKKKREKDNPSQYQSFFAWQECTYQCPVLGRGPGPVRQLFRQHGGRINVHGALGSVNITKVLIDHLSLFRHAKVAIDRVRRVCHNGQERLRITSPTHRAALT